MSFFQSILLGIVQGLTEFFPISSSAHLSLGKMLLGLPPSESFLLFDLLCHTGTLLALVIYLRREIFDLLSQPKKWTFYFLALLPLIPAYFFCKPLRTTLSHPSYLGQALIFTSVLLFLASRKKKLVPDKKWQHVVCIGMMQTMALIPGISRSGSTIAAARFCGWSFKEGALFSFLLAIPTIIGGEILEMIKMEKSASLDLSCYLGGMVTSFFFGLFSVRLVFLAYEKEKVRPFAWYCLGLGMVTWVMVHG